MQDLPLTPAQCRGGRAMLDWKQDRLAEMAGVSRPVVVDFERETRIPMPQNLAAIRRALEAAGLAFIERNGGGRGVRFTEPESEEADLGDPTSDV